MNKTILITGTSRGLGRTSAKLFIEKGWNVIATLRNPEAETELNQYQNVLVSELDIEKPDTIDKAIKEGIERFGKIDVLLNNAAYGQFGLFEAVTPEQVEKQFQVNVFGTMNVTRAMLPHFRANKAGKIVTISSGAGRVGMPMVSMYASSKFAVEGFAESLYYELLSQNIKVKLIEPGGVDTTFHQEAANKFASNENLSDYNSFVKTFTEKFENMHDGMATPQQVADVIFKAANDESNQLRYVIGNDVTTWLNYRLGKSEAEYIDYMTNMYEIK